MAKFARAAAVFLLSVACIPLHVQAASSAPSNLELVGGIYTNDRTPTFTWSRATGATWYQVKVNNGNYIDIGNVTSYTLGTQNDGWYTFTVRARSGSNNVGGSASLTFHIDTEGPTVPKVEPSSAAVGKAVTFSVEPYGEAWTDYCWLYVNGENVGSMTADWGVFTRSHTFSKAGGYTVYAKCTDGDGNATIGASRTVTVGGSSVPTAPAYGDPEEGDRIKLRCEGNTTVNDPCRAVYYYGEDGKRHVFPTADVYLSWYDSWSGIVEVDTDTMADIPLGKNVTYRPGDVLITFTSSDDIYALDAGATLRRYVRESLIQDDYGRNWHAALKTISDVFRGNYTTGERIDSASDYDPDDAYRRVNTIDETF